MSRPKPASRYHDINPVLEHTITRHNDRGMIRVACTCGMAFNTDVKRYANEWERLHKESIVKYDLDLKRESISR